MGTLVMSRAERARLEVLGRVRDGQLTVVAAAAALGISLRQARRLRRRHRELGDAGLVHRLRGRASNNRTPAATRSAVLARYRAAYAGFGPTLACEYLAKDGHVVSHDALGRWLRAEGLFERRRNRGRHRLRRPRRARAGELVQMDGSWHDWLEGRGGAPWCCLMVLVDDATGRVLARFYDKETLAAAFDAFGRYARTRGLPRALYVDKAGIYRPDDPGGPPTQFGRAMAELGVELILANSPQAKGRVERMNGTLQDRLCKELRLRGASTIAAANAVLDRSFLRAFNRRFAVAAAKRADAHRAAGSRTKLGDVLCEREERAVGRDWCVQWRGRVLQVDPRHAGLDLPRPGRRVTVVARADRTLLVRYAGQDLAWSEVSARPGRAKAKKAKKPVTNNRRYVPPADHPFNRNPACPGSRPAVKAPSATPPGP